ncbi:uncharacterized protein TRIADDRAFT_19523 [Trichoplax adhaerens]|uniref:Aspartyl/asparaginy/proline hydroxylase domain-containing protein n=1 Tax=Trichoplax adhaerens TaxID=10228 RepID=B3RK27_TRIAD|nr:hypothetical protein TRIADDRAFT_19523 [Trichoplax adhaerens]EDV29364.1 hypothetical protein TRIADDRAFT_19523 [Trichoplax adhaerens]|eukprot:XP_002108566.1 hypothetical protein TRIADDRAFT_19523 [Trichoplax adhaerens]
MRCGAIDYQLLHLKLQQFIKLTNSQEHLTNLYQVLDNIVKNDGITVKNASPCTLQCPTSLYLPYILTQPWYTLATNHPLMQDIQILQENLYLIRDDYYAAQTFSKGWCHNQEKEGSWTLFYLYNQGHKVVENCQICPQTTHLIDHQLRHFMRGNVFGNACFSKIIPSTKIAPHYGPCNYRIRCHLTLHTPSQCSLKVGNETRQWVDGQCLLFDDSYLHSVQHDSNDQDRVILLIDLWHYQLSPVERQALNFII